ncbi:hypothetical protein NKR19_g5425 [Coniochaeta hoffmannii]|uniref:Uncharacterized protein n=1 Tax=Coniochaeta hoffmannii TaxID=91930 RepID=A0AA38VT49_9PEZI|nr:hypothetical protein NKR19_g5425 [Coniochaeta hoffmannii]
MPSFSRKKGQMFVSRSHGLEAELNLRRERIDLRDFAVPLDNLLEPGIADQAMKSLADFVVEGSGTTIGLIYQDLDEQYRLMQQKLATKPEVPNFSPETLPEHIEQRRQKEKICPS